MRGYDGLHKEEKRIIHEEVIEPFKRMFDGVKEGENMLLDFGGADCSLLKFEKLEADILPFYQFRLRRQTTISCILQEYKGIRYHVYGCVYGTHRLDFTYDKELGIYLPFSWDKDMFLDLADLTDDGEVIKKEVLPMVITSADGIRLLLKEKEIVREKYFENVVEPFLAGEPTKFEVPRWKRHILPFNLRHMLVRYAKAVQTLSHGDFVYAGCKEEVYCMAVAKDEFGNPAMQGTYTTSAKPPLYFSNNYLEFISRHEAEMPKHKGDGPCNGARYRTYDIPGFGGKPFIFPQMGRTQNSKNTIFTGEPDIITGDVQEALAHFRTTDFAEFSDIVERYAHTMREIHPQSEKFAHRGMTHFF